MKLITRALLVALALLVIADFFDGLRVDGVYTAIIAAVILGVLNAFVRPILVILTLPITILTLGLFLLVINAGIVLFVASFVDGFWVSGFWSALLVSVLISLVGMLGNKYI